MNKRAESGGIRVTRKQMVKKIGPALGLAGILAIGCIAWQPAYAQNDTRVGLMLEVPFGGGQRGSFVHFDNTRIGAKIQYARVDDISKQNQQIIDRIYQDDVLQSSTTRPETTVDLNNGDKVTGGEVYFLVTPFSGKWNLSGGVNGFTGNKNFQGALGFGYDTLFGAYTQLGVLMPFSELGVRFNFHSIDYFAGLTSLGGFSPKTVWKDNLITYNDTFNTTPAPTPDTSGDTGSGTDSGGDETPPTGKM